MREDIINMWFQSWFHPEWHGFDKVFEEDVYYSESWGPEYFGIKEIEEWFTNWHKHSIMITWDIKQILHCETNSIVEWHFCVKNLAEEEDRFDGVSLIQWGKHHKIQSLKEFCSALPKYNPTTK